MNSKFILYNPYAGNGKCKKDVEALCGNYEKAITVDMSTIEDYGFFFSTLDEADEIILCGGDGTLNRFINDTAGIDINNKIYYYAVGSGNDFVRELGKEKGSAPTFPINDYLKNLPTVTVNNKKTLFLNGIGYGIDGYCCEVGDKLRDRNMKEKTDKPINYTAIAVKGLLFHYKPTNATITVDGKKHTYKKVWLAPTMNGRFYGGGMMPAPKQDRLAKEKSLSVMVFHNVGKLRGLMIFPSIFKGTHIKHTNVVEILCGKEITVEFDRPTPLQIDGETILNVRSYTARVSEENTMPNRLNETLEIGGKSYA